MAEVESPWTVRDLRRRWKPHKQRLAEASSAHPTAVRFHRACSWLRRAETLDGQAPEDADVQESGNEGEDDLDLRLLCRWVALNALFGRWDSAGGRPMLDKECCDRFIDRVLKLDVDRHLATMLTDHKKLVMALLDDEFLSRFYWADPTDKQAAKSKKAKFDARTWYLQDNWTMVISRVIERVYLARCQLAHGAATFGSKQNRKTLRRADLMLGHLLPAILRVWIDRGADEDWGELCYPPS